MYEETKSSIDWKGLFLKVIIAFLVILIGFKAYSVFKGDDKKTTTTTETIAQSKNSSTFTANMEKLKDAGENYFNNNKEKLPTSNGSTSMVTLNELIKSGEIDELTDEDGKNCDGESSYVTAILEGEKTKIKANLVCGNASSYSLVYMGENDNDIESTSTSNSSNGSYSTSTSTKKTSSNSSCTSSTCGSPSVTVSTNTKVSQSVNINNGSSSNKNTSSNNNSGYNNSYTSGSNNYRTYTVRFNSNGGNKTYASQTVNEYETAYNPGSTKKSGYTFIGWYLGNYKYDFSTPVTSDITLTARFEKNYSDYYNDNYYDDYYDDDYYDDYYSGTKKTTTTNVYSMGWDAYNASRVTVSHKLALPDINANYRTIRIKNIQYVKAINTTSLVNTYNSKHASTFLYSPNGWESSNTKSSTLATVSSAVFSYDGNYKNVYDAASNGFDVSWTSTGISKRCTPFTVYGPNGDRADNICNYGIVYKVTWEYIK